MNPGIRIQDHPWAWRCPARRGDWRPRKRVRHAPPLRRPRPLIRPRIASVVLALHPHPVARRRALTKAEAVEQRPRRVSHGMGPPRRLCTQPTPRHVPRAPHAAPRRQRHGRRPGRGSRNRRGRARGCHCSCRRRRPAAPTPGAVRDGRLRGRQVAREDHPPAPSRGRPRAPSRPRPRAARRGGHRCAGRWGRRRSRTPRLQRRPPQTPLHRVVVVAIRTRSRSAPDCRSSAGRACPPRLSPLPQE